MIKANINPVRNAPANKGDSSDEVVRFNFINILMETLALMTVHKHRLTTSLPVTGQIFTNATSVSRNCFTFLRTTFTLHTTAHIF